MFAYFIFSEHENNDSSFDMSEFILQGWIFDNFIIVMLVSIIITTIIITTIIFMSQDNTNVSLDDLIVERFSNPDNKDIELSKRLIYQLTHNSNYANQRFNYRSFPEGHAGHLNQELRIKLASYLKQSYIASHYKFGVSLGTIYKANSYTYAEVSLEMVGAIFTIEIHK